MENHMYIEHLAIWTADLELMKAFYTSYFRCTARQRYENHQKRFTSYFLTFPGGARLELMHRPGMPYLNPEETTGLAHFAIHVGTGKDVDRLAQRFQHDGYRVLSPPRFTGDGYYECVILDPEGNRIELTGDKT